MIALAHDRHAILALYWSLIVTGGILLVYLAAGLRKVGRWLGRRDARRARAAADGRWTVEPDGCQYDFGAGRCGQQVTDIVAGSFYCAWHADVTRRVIAAVITVGPRGIV